MVQISLPDTAVVDITVLQTIVNAINRHESVITQLSSSYSSIPGTEGVTDTNTEFNTVFNLSTHEIQFGRINVDSSSVITDGSDADTSGKQITVSFDRSFATNSVPTVVAVVRTKYAYYVETQSVTVADFKISVRGPSASSGIWVNWIAIGTRG